MLARPILATSLVFGGALLSLPAQAQSTEKAFQVGLLTPIVSYSKQSTDMEDSDTEVDVSTTLWGLRSGFSSEIGYGLSDSMILGGLVQIGGNSQEVEFGNVELDASDFSLFLGPKFDYMFMPGSNLRPFVGAVAGLQVSSGENSGVEISTTAFQGMLRGGVRWFIARGMSIDPGLAFSFNFGSVDVESGGAERDGSVSGFGIGLVLGFSGWLH